MMRRFGFALWALWLALTPIGVAWAYACACKGSLSLQCCSVRASVQSTCCAPAAESTCCSRNAQCTDCPGCRLERAPAEPATIVSQFTLSGSDWVMDAPELAAFGVFETPCGGFDSPTIYNHSPPLRSSAPRAPPLC
ncbi:MAG: hypothetical protein KatS3mg016_2006 [Fimbriimonadales bacterium]|nr:MAG: hypothetical protein KatS3mg016_2006 [Fimbriimonadales bacterium]